MTGAREILTLQVGNYSNFIGAHFFNFQDPQVNPEQNEEFEPNVFWQEHAAPRRQSIWTPRTLIFDLKSNCENVFVRSEGLPNQHDMGLLGLPLEQLQQQSLWHGKIQCVPSENDPLLRLMRKRGTISEGEPTGNSVIASNLSGTETLSSAIGGNPSRPTSWLDYIRWRLHQPQESVFTIPNLSYNSVSGVLFNYEQGLQIYTRQEEEITNAIRRHLEPCDFFEGFHVLTDQDDGFAGLARGLLQHLSDEYEKKCCVGFGCSPAQRQETASDFRFRMMNTALMWHSFVLHSDVFTTLGLCDDVCKVNPGPVQLRNLQYKADSAFDSSYILAAFLDSISTGYRQRNSNITLSEVVAHLNRVGHKMFAVGMDFPFVMKGDDSLYGTLNGSKISPQSLTPGVHIEIPDTISNFLSLRGILQERVTSKNDNVPYRVGITNAESCLRFCVEQGYPMTLNTVKSIVTPFKLSHPFVPLIDQRLLGTQVRSVTHDFSQEPKSWDVPVLATAHNTQRIGELVNKLVLEAGGNLSTNNTRDHIKTALNTWSDTLDYDDYMDRINDLLAFRELYKLN